MGKHNYAVGPIAYPRPLCIRRLEHFGCNLGNLDERLDCAKVAVAEA